MSTATYKAPDGFFRIAEAAAILGMSCVNFKRRVEMGIFPQGEWYIPSGAVRSCRFPIWKKADILALAEEKIPAPDEKPAPGKALHLSGEAAALLMRLQAHADERGFVSGDATDLVLGNPCHGERNKAILGQLIGAGLIVPDRDNWDRMTFRIKPPERQADGSYRAFGPEKKRAFR